MRLAGHLARHDEILTHLLFLLELQHRHQRRGPLRLTYVDILRRNPGLDDSKEINKFILDIKIWRETIAARNSKPP
jgi:hypothetical protein